MKKDEILFAKMDKGATIPSKRDEDAGYDIYALPVLKALLTMVFIPKTTHGNGMQEAIRI